MILRNGDVATAESLAPRSQTSMAYEIIRSDILNGRHTPDKKLKIQELAAELDVSPGAVREALSRLVPEQLVVPRDQRGFVVATLSLADLEDLTDVRCEIEAIALRRSVELGDVDWEANIVAAEYRLHSSLAGLDPDEAKRVWVRNHADFHNALISACGSRRLLAMHAQFYEQSERYRGLQNSVEPERQVENEHRQIVELALARDADGLVDATLRHIRLTTEVIVRAYLQDNPGVERRANCR